MYVIYYMIYHIIYIIYDICIYYIYVNELLLDSIVGK